MSKLIATMVASLFAAAAFAQQTVPGQPPVQPAAGTTASAGPTKTPSADKPVTDKKAARVARSKARKAKRDADVGPKPLN